MEQFTFMAVIKGISTTDKATGKETNVKMLVLAEYVVEGSPEAATHLAELVGKAVNVTIEGSQRRLDEA